MNGASPFAHPPLHGMLVAPERPAGASRHIRRFEPAYWIVDNPLSASASIITNGPNGLVLTGTLRTKNDIIGLKWQSVDRWSFPQLRYSTSRNYAGCTLEFDYALSGLPPLDDAHGLVLTAISSSGASYYVKLSNYATGNGRSGHVRLAFTTDPVFGGFNVVDPAQRVIVPWHDIDEMFIGFASPEYNQRDEPIIPIEFVFTMSNISVTGSNTDLSVSDFAVQPHSLRMTDGYDDAYNLTPERIVEGIWALGYRDWYVIYIGASHLHDLAWQEAENRLVVNSTFAVSRPSRAWFRDLFHRLAARGYRVVVSQSYEILASFCPSEWQQMDYAGLPARTGWTPPSTLIAPTNFQALAYLRDVARCLLEFVREVGAATYYQIGEPWWWDGSYSGGGPCFYDPTTTSLYTAETGLAVPTPYITSASQPVGHHGEFLRWLGHKLGRSTNWLRDEVRARFPGVQVMALIFTPQILNPASPIITLVNFPHDEWMYPAFDTLQLEDYDWVSGKEWHLHETTIGAGTEHLGYPLAKLHFFAGFNLLPETAADVWPSIQRAASDGFEWGVAEVFVWARPQVWRDGWLYPVGDLVAPPEEEASSGVDQNALMPTNPTTQVNSWGDILLSFSPNGEAAKNVYHVEILSAAGGAVVRTFTIPYPIPSRGAVWCEYPLEMRAADLGDEIDRLSWRVRVNGGKATTGTTTFLIPNDQRLVRQAVAVVGGSMAAGHCSSASGAHKGLRAATRMRADIAQAIGARRIEILPLNATFAGSAADKTAQAVGDTANYWWDCDASAPGPRLLEAADKLAPYRSVLRCIVLALGDDDASALDGAAPPRSTTVERVQDAITEVIAYLRSALGNPSLPVWLQPVGRAYRGVLGDEIEVGGVARKALRDAQFALVDPSDEVRLGTFSPGAEGVEGYVQTEAGDWISFSPTTYSFAAAEIAAAINGSLTRPRPAWALLDAPTGLSVAHATASYDIIASWDAGVADIWRVRNRSVVDQSVLHQENVGTPAWTFTNAAQIAAYGFAATFASVDVCVAIAGAVGPPAQWYAEVPVIAAPTGLGAVRDPAGPDILFTWDDVPGAAWRVQNISVTDGSILAEAEATANSWTFTNAAQVAAYGFTATYVSFRVARIGGLQASHEAGVPMHPAPTGLSATKLSGGDIVVSWDGIAGARWIVTNRNVATGGVLSEVEVTANAWTFTNAAQVAAYGFTASYLTMTVTRIGGGATVLETSV